MEYRTLHIKILDIAQEVVMHKFGVKRLKLLKETDIMVALRERNEINDSALSLEESETIMGFITIL